MALSALSPRDHKLFVQYGVGPSRHVEIEVVHHAFARHARAQPDAIAVEHVVEGRQMTYRELDEQSNSLALALRARGVVPGNRVLILARRSIELIVAILAVLKAGGAYVPLDAVTVKDSTLQHVLSDAKPTLALVMADYTTRLDGFPHIVLEDALTATCTASSSSQLEDMSSPMDPIYVIYTSGTTGTPKGVLVRHDGVANVLSGPHSKVGMAPGLRVAQLLNIGFDMGAWEILGSLYNGCTLCLRGNTSKDWSNLLRTVHVVISTPTILARHDPFDYPTIRYVIVGGEPCPQSLADRWAQYVSFSNCCGPTEISVMNTVAPSHTPGYPLSIGKPIPNTNVYILDLDTQLSVPIGEVGVMWVGGRGVSLGYLNLPERTAERWQPDPFYPDANERGMMFCTGDLARWREDGEIEHRGRADDQVKVKGFRVELDGVSSAMRESGTCRAAVALLIDSTLWGFVSPCTVDVEEVKRRTAEVQPYYAVPTRFLALDAFPTTGNGKVDKRALRELVLAREIVRIPPSLESLPLLEICSSCDSSSSSEPQTPTTDVGGFDDALPAFSSSSEKAIRPLDVPLPPVLVDILTTLGRTP